MKNINFDISYFDASPEEVIRMKFIRNSDLSFLKEHFSVLHTETDLSRTENMSLEILEENIDDERWAWRLLSQRSYLNIEFVIKHSERPWDWFELSRNRSVCTLENVLLYSQCPWSWREVSKSIQLSIERFTDQHLSLPWHMIPLHSNKTLTRDLIEKYPKGLTVQRKYARLWNWSHLSANARVVDPEYIEAHPEIKWNWRFLSVNPNIFQI
jgi:hypothetical protein